LNLPDPLPPSDGVAFTYIRVKPSRHRNVDDGRLAAKVKQTV